MKSRDDDERLPWKMALLGALLVLLAFLPTLKNGPVWDDHHLVVGNPYFQSWSGIADLFRHDMWTTTALGVRSEYYRPLPMLSFAADRFLGGGSVAVYHLGNALLHALVVAALALALARALRAQSSWIPVVFAAAWGLSPMSTEPVAWISGRFDLLATLFTVLAVLANLGETKTRRALTVVFVAASLLCKEAAILGAVVLAASDLLLSGRRPRTLVFKYAALALVIGSAIGLRRWVGVITASAAVEPLELARSYAFMITSVLLRTVWPSGLDAFHPYEPAGIITTCVVLGSLGVVGSALLGASVRAREPHRYRVALFGMIWFCLMLAPAALTGPALDMVGDRYAYLPNVGLAFAGAALAMELRARLSLAWPARRIVIAGASLSAIALAASTVVSVTRLRDWRDDRSLIEASLRAHPGNPYALYSLGERDVLAGKYEEGDRLLRRAIETGPRPWRALNALCFSLLNQNRHDEGAGYCQQSLAINGRDPRTWINLASIRVRQKRWDEALQYARKARQYRARYSEAHYVAAVSLANLGRLDEAQAELKEALRLEPEHKPALSLARQFQKRGLSSL